MPNGQTRATLLVGLFFAMPCAFAPAIAYAGPADAQAQRGVAAAQRGRCEEAIPLLEEAEGLHHRPSTALVLADCYAEFGELVQASVLYAVIAEDQPERGSSSADRAAIESAGKKAAALDERIPTLSFSFPAGYESPAVTIDNEPVESLKEPHKVDPNKELAIVIRAKGRKERKQTITLQERERRVLNIELDADDTTGAKTNPTSSTQPKAWIGGAFPGFLIPKFVMNMVGDGGRTVFAPGGAATLTRPSGDLDLVFSLGYALFYMPPTPFKAKGTPDTEYEIVQTDLNALTASFELLYNVPLDAQKRVRFRIGAGLGLGFTFLGQIYRRQSYPASLVPSDPNTYLPCYGPNNPPGSFRYCNQLDKDANHYGAFAEPSWFDGGVRPLIYPWLALPLVGLSFRPSPKLAIDVEIAPTLSGLLTGVGVRFGL